MTVRIFDTYEDLSRASAEMIVNLIRQKPDAVVCVPSGDTPKGTFRYLVSMVKEEAVDVTRVTFVGLDEWVGIPRENPGSCGNFLRKWLFDPLNLEKEQVHLFNGVASDLQAECERMDSAIRKVGGLDLMLVGIGINGHIGLNEPGVTPEQYAHVMELAATTRDVGQKYFQEKTTLTKGITLGLKYLLEAGAVLLIANGEKKSTIIRATISGPISTEVPSTILHKHHDAFVYIDQEAAEKLHHE